LAKTQTFCETEIQRNNKNGLGEKNCK